MERHVGCRSILLNTGTRAFFLDALYFSWLLASRQLKCKHFLFSLFLFPYQNSSLPVKSTKVSNILITKIFGFGDDANHKIMSRKSIFSTFFLFGNLKNDCLFSIKLQASNDGCSLDVISISEEHNHEISEVSNRLLF